MDISQITYHRLEEKHLSDVKVLFLEVFNKKVTLAQLKAKYNTSYTGVNFISTMAYLDEKPIAFYGAIPQLFTRNNEKFIAAHACDSFTLKKFQGKGIHYQLAQLAYKIMKENHVKFVYAFHSENTFHSTKKLDWLTHQNLERFHIQISTIPKAKIYRKVGLSNYYQTKIANHFRTYQPKTELPFVSKMSCQQNYQSDFFDYKNSIFPHHCIALEHCQFYFKVDAIMQIGYFIYPSVEQFIKAINKLKLICKTLGINEILFQVSPNSAMSEALKTIAQPQQSWLVGYLPFGEIDINEFEFTFADLDTF